MNNFENARILKAFGDERRLYINGTAKWGNGS